MKLRAQGAAWLAAIALVALAGCASPPRTAELHDPDGSPWNGRLALQIQDQASQSFSASFELKGSARSGELTLFGPLGGTLAALTWQPGGASLNADGQVRHFESVDAIVAHVTGAAIPIGALFDWLRGIDTPVEGWRADLSLLGQGRLGAKRLAPAPEADLRVVFER